MGLERFGEELQAREGGTIEKACNRGVGGEREEEGAPFPLKPKRVTSRRQIGSTQRQDRCREWKSRREKGRRREEDRRGRTGGNLMRGRPREGLPFS